MKPIKLTVKAFGAFAKETIIDFSLPSQESLFLISGQTGSGKTTIFDGLCFALYGVSSGLRKELELRSQYAVKKESPEVSLVFEVAGKRYFVCRSLKFIDSKTGKTVSGKDSFYECGLNNEMLSSPITKSTEIKNKITEIVGMNSEQFTQIILLPQGQFEKFLLSTANEKKEILNNLFHTDIYERLTNLLKDKSKAAIESVKNKDIEKNALLKSRKVETIEEIEKHLNIGKTELSDLEAGLTSLTEDKDNATTARHTAETLNSLFNDFDIALRTFKTHEAGKPGNEANENLLKKYKSAESMRTAAAEFENRKSDSKRLETEKRNFEQSLKTAVAYGEKLSLEKRNLDSEESAVNSKQAEKTTLSNLVPKIKRGEVIDIELNMLSREIVLKESEIRQNGSTITVKQKRIAEIETENPLLVEIVKTNGTVQAESVRLNNVLRQIEYRDNKEKELQSAILLEKKLLEIYDKAAGAFREKQTEFEKAEKVWRASQSHVLALKLEEGVECPVCGSKEHPFPAGKPDRFISDDQLKIVSKSLKDLQDKRDDAQKKYNEAQSNQGTKAAALNEIKINLGTEFETSKAGDITLRISINSNEAAKIEITGKKLKSNEIEKTEANKLIESLRSKEQKLNENLNDAKNRHTALTAEKTSILKELPAHIVSESQLNNAIDLLTRAIADFEKRKTSLAKNLEESIVRTASLNASLNAKNTEYENCISDFREREVYLLADANRNGFRSIEDVKLNLKPESERKLIENKIKKWGDDYLSLQTRLDTAESKVERKERPDLQTFKIAENQASEKYSAAVSSIGGLKIRIKSDSELIEKYGAYEKELIELRKWRDLASGLYELAKGNNSASFPLTSYVLSAFLENVLTSANLRLRRFSLERYELIRKEEPNTRGYGGLEINVVDNYSGHHRSVSTLSGGEMFYVSLSLALGLSDVVSSYIGGIKLDAMFIDEGFGSLDDQTLDVAIQTITSLHSNNRIVGIISHVKELKERIPLRLEVEKGTMGSSVSWKRNNMEVKV